MTEQVSPDEKDEYTVSSLGTFAVGTIGVSRLVSISPMPDIDDDDYMQRIAGNNRNVLVTRLMGSRALDVGNYDLFADVSSGDPISRLDDAVTYLRKALNVRGNTLATVQLLYPNATEISQIGDTT